MRETTRLGRWARAAARRHRGALSVVLTVALVMGNLVPSVPARAVDDPSDSARLEATEASEAAETTVAEDDTASEDATGGEQASPDAETSQDAAATDDGQSEQGEAETSDADASAEQDATDEPQATDDAAETHGELTATSEHYRVTVGYDQEAGIPEGAQLTVREYPEASEEYRDAYEAVIGIDYDADAQADDGVEYGELDESGEVPYREVIVRPVVEQASLSLEAMDITILDEQGAVIEPSASVRVSVVRTTLPDDVDEQTFAETASVSHHDESTGEVSVETVAAAGENTPGTLVVEDGELKADFTTESFSTFTVTWGTSQRATVHYVDESGNELTVANGTPSATTTPSYLIYDIDGYEYSYTYLNNRNDRIVPELQYVSSYYGGRWTYTTRTTGQWNGSELSNNDDIYVVYTPKAEPTQGGTPRPHPSGGSEEPAEPEIEKLSDDNGDGTRTLSLSITGHTVPMEVEKLADVIVVFDVSGSMNYNMAGNATNNTSQQRITIAKNAVNDLTDSLLAKTNSAGEPLIRMSLISFSNDATLVQGFTESASTFKSAVNGLSANGGTNWESALQMANEMQVDPDRATFVIFVTDGDPTFRLTRGVLGNGDLDVYEEYYRRYNLYGAGNSDAYGRNFDAALTEATSIVNQGKHFYTIGISNDVSNLTSLTTQAGAGADHSHTATSGEELVAAFDDIAASIESTLGWGDVTLTDGITGLTNLTAKAPLVGVDEGSFSYWRSTDGGATWETWDPAAAGAGEAVYNTETGAVEWSMGENFMLEDGVTYKVSFLVWPSQAAMDLVTQLNNGERDFADLSEEEAAQVIRSGSEGTGYSYTLRTNTDNAQTTYHQAVQTGDDVSVIGEEHSKDFGDVEPLVLDTMTMKVEKVWTDTLNAGEHRDPEVQLHLQRRTVNQDGTTGEWEDFAAPYVDPDGNSVHSSTIRLSDANDWQVEFYISPGLIASGTTYNPGYEFRLVEPTPDDHYEFTTEIVKPMLIDLVRTYVGDSDGSGTLTGENVVKGDIVVEKVVTNADGTEVFPDEQFTIRGSIVDAEGNPLGAHDTVLYDLYDRDGALVAENQEVSASDQIEIALGAGCSAHFKNVPSGCTFTFSEVTEGMTEGYEFASAAGEILMREEPNGSFVPADEQPSVSGATVTGPVLGNARHSVTYTNRVQTVDLGLVKTDDRGREIAGAHFQLWQGDTLVADDIVLGSHTVEGLYPGIYRLVETQAPAGYDQLEAPIWFKVAGTTVTLYEPEGEATANDHATFQASNLTLSISNTPGTELPSAGGPGTAFFVSCGVALIAVASVIGALSSRRKRERGSNA